MRPTKINKSLYFETEGVRFPEDEISKLVDMEGTPRSFAFLFTEREKVYFHHQFFLSRYCKILNFCSLLFVKAE
jgi:hypothetical protein